MNENEGNIYEKELYKVRFLPFFSIQMRGLERPWRRSRFFDGAGPLKSTLPRPFRLESLMHRFELVLK